MLYKREEGETKSAKNIIHKIKKFKPFKPFKNHEQKYIASLPKNSRNYITENALKKNKTQGMTNIQRKEHYNKVFNNTVYNNYLKQSQLKPVIQYTNPGYSTLSINPKYNPEGGEYNYLIPINNREGHYTQYLSNTSHQEQSSTNNTNKIKLPYLYRRDFNNRLNKDFYNKLESQIRQSQFNSNPIIFYSNI